MNIQKTISLVGMMSSGKTILGKYLANALGFSFYDSDKEVEKYAKKNIATIFKEDSEEKFREIEQYVVFDLIKCLVFPSVISLGGGSFSNKEIRENLLKNTFVIYINVDLDILINRLSKSNLDKRPLLANVDNIEEYIRNMYEERKIYYEMAHFTLDNSTNNPKDSLKKLLLAIKNHN